MISHPRINFIFSFDLMGLQLNISGVCKEMSITKKPDLLTPGKLQSYKRPFLPLVKVGIQIKIQKDLPLHYPELDVYFL